MQLSLCLLNSLLSGFRETGGLYPHTQKHLLIPIPSRLWSKHFVILYFWFSRANEMCTKETQRLKKNVQKIEQRCWLTNIESCVTCDRQNVSTAALCVCMCVCGRLVFFSIFQFFNFRLFFSSASLFLSFFSRELITRSAGSHGNDFLFMTSYRLG